MCPGTNGACIYQARALYNTIFGQEVNYEGCGEASGNRAANNSNIENIIRTENVLEVGLFPNPASELLTIICNEQKDLLNIEIKDVSGRIVLIKKIHTKNQRADLYLSLINGIYFITISDSKNRTFHEKLLITK